MGINTLIQNIYIMIRKLKYTLLLFLTLVVSCDEYEVKPYTNDGVAPDDVSNIVITPANGGLDIKFDLPPSKDVLFVEAFYSNNKGERVSTRTSAFNNTLKIEGFGDISEKTIEIFTVDRGENRSKGVTKKATPLTPIVDLAAESAEIAVGFGGAKYSWINETEVPLVIEIHGENDKGELVLVNQIYSKFLEDKYSLRGYTSTPHKFAIRIKDRYDNKSDFIYPNTPNKTLTPLLESRLDKKIMEVVQLDNDAFWGAWQFNINNVIDDNLSEGNMIHTWDDVERPTLLTIDLGQEVGLSRFTLYQRSGTWGWRHGNPKDYTIYGSLTEPSQDGNLDNWIKLRECHSIKPSGLPVGTQSDDDRQKILIGEEWEFEETIKIRYFRIAVHKTWGDKRAAHIRELTFWGSIN